jgi:SNF2 family DNA or RNA helicase
MKLPALFQQTTALTRSYKQEAFGFFMEQGTGKTYVELAEAEALFLDRLIDQIAIIAPSGVHLNWALREVPKLVSVPHVVLVWTPNHTKRFIAEANAYALCKGSPRLRIIVLNVEAFSMKKSKAEVFLKRLMKLLRTLLAVDESSTIKNSSQRTKNIIRVGRDAIYRRLLTGTPITQSPLNAYWQFEFLGSGLLGFDTFTAFKAHYGEWRERTMLSNNPAARALGKMVTFKELIRYRNLGELKRLIDSHSFTITKKECLDLPDKIYDERLVQLTDRQREIYETAKQDLLLILDDGTITIAHAFTRLTRLSQIAGGFIKYDDATEPVAIEGANPKVQSLLQYVEEVDERQKIIVWARYSAELRAIADALGRRNCALYWGETDGVAKSENIDKFMTDPACRFFVGNPKSGKFGFTLTVASTVVYFSNDYSAEARWQSEDRVHRIGQTEKVTYTDLTAINTVDRKILRILREHRSMADMFKGDQAAMRRWLTEEDE